MKDLDTRIFKLLKQKPFTLNELSDMLRISENNVRQYIKLLREKGVDIKHKDNIYNIISSENTSKFYVYSPASTKKIERTIAISSDWHIGSVQHDKEGLEECVYTAKDLGVEFIVHSGDMHDGYGVYHGQLNNLITWDINRQTDMSAQEIETLGINIYGIGGNHDFSYTKQNGARPTGMLARKTKLFHDMGDFQADFVLDGIEIRMLHGDGGNAYALSYSAQKYLRNLAEGTPEQVPDMLAIGHFHTNPVFQIYGCLVIHPSNFQKPNDYMIRRGLRGARGLYVLEMETQNGSLLDYDIKFIGARTD